MSSMQFAKKARGGCRLTPPTHNGGTDMPRASLNPGDSKTVIYVSPPDVPRIAAEAWDALTAYDDPPTIFLYGAEIVRLNENVADKRIILESMNKDRMKHHLNRSADWRDSEDNIKSAPHPVASDMLANPDPPLPRLRRIVNHPIYTGNKALCLTPGYSREEEIYLHNDGDLAVPPVPDTPSTGELKMAIEIVEEIFVDFPFAGGSDQAHSIAILLLPFVMDLIDGPTPLHFIEAPSPGTGKTLLALSIGTAVTGHQISTKSQCRDEDEWRRTITGVLRSAPEFYLIDNVKKELESAALASALSSTVWEDRILGKSETIVLPIRTVWLATGNNPIFASEMARRVIPIRLDSEVQRPWLEGKKTYKHEPLLPWIKGSRSVIIWAVLVIIQNWIAKGCPDPENLPALGSYEEYRRVIGGMLQTAGIQGFLGNLQTFYQSSDEETQALTKLIHYWWDNFQDREVGVNELYPLIKNNFIPLDLGKSTLEHNEKTALGRLLPKLRDRQFGQYRILQEGPKQGAQQYRLILVENEPPNEAH
jgi:putative DNA primase/helicase